MKKTDWKDIAELVGIAAIVASLIFVGLQMKQAQDIAYSELDVSLLAIQAEATNLISANSDVWVRGNAGEELSPAETAVFSNLVALLNGRWFVEYRHATQLGRTDIAETIKYDWSAFLYQNPGARRVWLAREENLNKFRDILLTEGNKWTFWRDSINADLTRLDAIGE
ncbi:MAG: hypothetical protein DRI30_08110 [Chloroflexi bacterium]|nr:MAG: hypothetical protein DRI30_08110 [Chloroflexota bacterium]